MSKLKPEHDRMVDVFLTNFAYFDSNEVCFIEDISVDDVITQNNSLFVMGKVGGKTLPHEPDWVWNQSKSKMKIVLNPYECVTLAKLNPRKHSKSRKDTVRPTYKLWDCNTFSPRTKGKEVHFLWVEKGKELNVSSANNKDLNILDFSFLKDFVEPHIALQFGWQ